MDPLAACRRVLEASHTFARPVELLPERLGRSVTCACVLCRVADTIEDDPAIAAGRKRELFDAFLALLEGRDAAAIGDDRLPPALDLLRTLPAAHREICVRWVGELARGMAIYCLRAPGSDGIVAPTTLADLERYCHFAAGTVGLLLSDLFLEEIPGLPSSETVRDLGETYGLALQFVNTLRDVPRDLEEKRSFVPRSLCADLGGLLLDPARAHRTLAPLYARAKELLAKALEFGIVMPREVRAACLIPLWLAVPTLRRHEGNDEALVPGRSLRLAREEAGALLEDLRSRESVPALRDGFARLLTGASSAPSGGPSRSPGT